MTDKKTKTAKILVDFEFPMNRSDFSTPLDLRRHRSKCREAALKSELTRLRYQLKQHGLTKNEWLAVLADCIKDAVQR